MGTSKFSPCGGTRPSSSSTELEISDMFDCTNICGGCFSINVESGLGMF